MKKKLHYVKNLRELEKYIPICQLNLPLRIREYVYAFPFACITGGGVVFHVLLPACLWNPIVPRSLRVFCYRIFSSILKADDSKLDVFYRISSLP